MKDLNLIKAANKLFGKACLDPNLEVLTWEGS